MIKYCALISTMALCLNASLYADWYHTPTLNRIINKWQGGKVTVENSDDNSGKIVLKENNNYREYSNSQDAFDVRNVTSINYRIPEANDGKTRGGWGNLYIKVYQDGVNEPIAQAELQANWANNQNAVELFARGNGSNVTPSKIRYRNEPLSITVLVDKNGVISLPDLITIRVNNGTGAPVEINSPDCSLETADIMNIRLEDDPKERRDITIIYNPAAQCKIVATTIRPSRYKVPQGSQATMCITDIWQETDHCHHALCKANESGEYMCCYEDPFTGENVCNRGEITWVRGNRKNLNDKHALYEYGLIVTQEFKNTLSAQTPAPLDPQVKAQQQKQQTGGRKAYAGGVL